MSVTKLLFQTPVEHFTIAAGQQTVIGYVDVSEYRQIRVVYANWVLSNVSATFWLSIDDVSRNDLVGTLEGNEGMILAPDGNISTVYDVPGTKLAISVLGGAGTGTAVVDIWIYGHS